MVREIFSLLKYLIPELLPLLLMISLGYIFGPAGIGYLGQGEDFWKLLTEATPILPLLPKPCHANPAPFSVNGKEKKKYQNMFFITVVTLP